MLSFFIHDIVSLLSICFFFSDVLELFHAMDSFITPSWHTLSGNNYNSNSFRFCPIRGFSHLEVIAVSIF
ncbi:hypothetical protein HOE425_333045 [Hoeflea sp. EC-HK425]|nr:hypothetical protein HOE425_333045 [Hoeflea sp. EC-HK425]